MGIKENEAADKLAKTVHICRERGAPYNSETIRRTLKSRTQEFCKDANITSNNKKRKEVGIFWDKNKK